MNAAASTSLIPLGLGVLVLLWRGPATIGWLLIAHALSVALLLGPPLALLPSAIAGPLRQASQGAWVFLYLWLVLIAYLVPSGRPASRAWRRWLWLCMAGTVLFLLGAAAAPDPGFAQLAPVVSGSQWLPEVVANVLGVVGLVSVIAFIGGAVVSVGVRMRGAVGDERRSLLWLVWGALSLPLGLLLFWLNVWFFAEQTWVIEVTLVSSRWVCRSRSQAASSLTGCLTFGQW
ncbi:hypothetical protein ACXR2T_03645 [Leucobacter sp. HY1910]